LTIDTVSVHVHVYTHGLNQLKQAIFSISEHQYKFH